MYDEIAPRIGRTLFSNFVKALLTWAFLLLSFGTAGTIYSHELSLAQVFGGAPRESALRRVVDLISGGGSFWVAGAVGVAGLFLLSWAWTSESECEDVLTDGEGEPGNAAAHAAARKRYHLLLRVLGITSAGLWLLGLVASVVLYSEIANPTGTETLLCYGLVSPAFCYAFLIVRELFD